MKCTRCKYDECKRNYANKAKCTGKSEMIDECNCICQVKKTQEHARSLLSMSGGIIGVSGGMFLTLTKTGKLSVFGASLFSAASTLILIPIRNLQNGERMNVKRNIKELAINGSIGAIYGSLTLLSSSMRSSELIKYTSYVSIGTCVGSFHNYVEKMFDDTNEKSSGPLIDLNLTIIGIFAGISNYFGKILYNIYTNEVIRTIAKLTIEAITVILFDCGLQLIEYGFISTKRMLNNIFNHSMLNLSSELGKNFTKRTRHYNHIVNLDLIKNNIHKDKIKNPQKFKEQLMIIHNEINSLPSNLVVENLRRVKLYNETKSKLNELKFNKAIMMSIHALEQKNFTKNFNLPNILDMKRLEYDLKSQRPKLMGENNMHFLIGPRSGQIAVDLGPRDVNGRRCAQRVIFEKFYGKFIYTDHTMTHDYSSCRKSSRIHIKDSSEDALNYFKILSFVNNENL